MTEQPQKAVPPATQSMEDYLERIHELIESHGYARAVDIADALQVQQPSVTKMVQRLDEAGYVVYEKYRGLVLTERGDKLARSVRRRHRILERFLALLGLDADTVQRDVEGIEHHVSRATIDAIRDLALFLEERPELQDVFLAFRREREDEAAGASAPPAPPPPA